MYSIFVANNFTKQKDKVIIFYLYHSETTNLRNLRIIKNTNTKKDLKFNGRKINKIPLYFKECSIQYVCVKLLKKKNKWRRNRKNEKNNKKKKHTFFLNEN